MTPVIVTFTSAATDLGQRLATFTGGEFHQLKTKSNAAAQLQNWFKTGTPVIGICAAGILIRLLAPVLIDKHIEPPVIAISTDGNHIIPLLGGHHGANSLAEKLATELGAIAAVTTASDSRFAFGLDEPPTGTTLANPEAAKSAMAAVLNGENLKVSGDPVWLENAGYPISETGKVKVTINDQTVATDGLIYNPKTLIAGVGCARGTSAEEIITLIETTFANANLATKSLAAIATIDIKADETGLHQAAAHFGVPLRLFTAAELATQTPPNPSDIVRAEIGTPSVSEAAAMLAGALIVEKQKTKSATIAISRATSLIDPETLGRAPGQLHIVGIGPGEPISRTASAVTALRTATDWVGYGLYLDLIADLKHDQTEHRFDLGDEEVRVRHALEEAAKGKTVALVCSGDAQIYAMAALVYELLDATGPRAVSDVAQRVAVESHPGISAVQMASARAGALIGHDFCCISLSDLLTPRAAIHQRLEAAATGDFVTAFYNPRSKRRTDLLDHAKALFQKHRPPETPVIIASNLGRPTEQVRVVTLETFNPEEVDMLTIVLIGSSQSRAFTRGDGQTVTFTPRGYSAKHEPAASPSSALRAPSPTGGEGGAEIMAPHAIEPAAFPSPPVGEGGAKRRMRGERQ